MTAELAAEAILFYLGVLALYLLWRFAWKPHLVDALRQHLFRIRDEVFDDQFVKTNGGERLLRDVDYDYVRESLNAQIHYAHQMTVLDVLVTRFLLSAQVRGARAEQAAWLRQFKAKATRSQHLYVLRTFRRAHAVIAAYFFLLNPILWPFFGAYVLARGGAALVTTSARGARKVIAASLAPVGEHLEGVLAELAAQENQPQLTTY